jgi:hypothetical protein
MKALKAGLFTPCFSLLRYVFTSFFSSPETAAPLPQRWGLPRKGRAVFRREDRLSRFSCSPQAVEAAPA